MSTDIRSFRTILITAGGKAYLFDTSKMVIRFFDESGRNEIDIDHLPRPAEISLPPQTNPDA